MVQQNSIKYGLIDWAITMNKLDDVFGLKGELVEDVYQVTVIPESRSSKEDIDSDYTFARKNLYELIQKSTGALDTLLELAKASESPRAFEIVGSLTKTLMEANRDLLDVQRKVKELKEEKTKKELTEVTNNNLFVGTTTELLEMIKSGQR